MAMSGQTGESMFQAKYRIFMQFAKEHPTVVSAGPASLISTIASFPFDSIKSRLQVKNYPSVWACTRAVVREEGVQGLFRGVTIPLITITFVRTMSFVIYNNTKKWLEGILGPSDPHLWRTAMYGSVGGVASGVVISCMAAPFELVKIERQLEFLIASQRAQKEGTQFAFKPRSGTQAAWDIYKNHGGIRGFYLGLRIHMLRDLIGTAFYFGLYDTVREVGDRLEAQNKLTMLPSPVVSFLIGSFCGIVSWQVVYPLDLLKTQVQRNALAGLPNQSSYMVFRRLLLSSKDGVEPPEKVRLSDIPFRRFLRLYRGLGISVLRSFISHGITWSVIESITRHVESEKNDHHLDVSYDFVDF
ncbi:acyl carnitine transmembrane transporter [Malassezia pachydermatis]